MSLPILLLTILQKKTVCR